MTDMSEDRKFFFDESRFPKGLDWERSSQAEVGYLSVFDLQKYDQDTRRLLWLKAQSAPVPQPKVNALDLRIFR